MKPTKICVWPTVIALTLSTSLARAYELPEKNVTLGNGHAGARETLEGLLSNAGVGYDIEAAVSDETKVTVSTSGRWESIFKDVLRQADLTYGFDKRGKILVMRR